MEQPYRETMFNVKEELNLFNLNISNFLLLLYSLLQEKRNK